MSVILKLMLFTVIALHYGILVRVLVSTLYVQGYMHKLSIHHIFHYLLNMYYMQSNV